MSFKVTPLDMISAPNSYAPLADGTWTFTSPNTQTLWFRLDVVDALGQRPYVAANGATMVLTFQRSDLISVNTQGNLVNTVNNVVKTAAAHTNNRALFSVAMTAQDIQKAISGTVKFDFTENPGGGVMTTTWVQNWLVKKLLTDPGH